MASRAGTTSNGTTTADAGTVAPKRPASPGRGRRGAPAVATRSPAAAAAALADGVDTTLGTASPNVDGRAIAITVFSTVQWPGRVWLPAVFYVGTHCAGLPVVRNLPSKLAKLSFIHFARWTLVRGLPDNGQQQEQLSYPHLYFESNFNGGWAEYIDAFSHILTSGMKIFWGTSYGFPQPLPTGPFKIYIQRNETVASHFYSAYPQATTTMILSGLALEEKLAAFDLESSDVGDAEFALRWRDFLADVQELI